MAETAPAPHFVSTSALCRLASVDRKTLAAWVKRFGFPAPARVGKSLRWDWPAARSWLEARKEVPAHAG